MLAKLGVKNTSQSRCSIFISANKVGMSKSQVRCVVIIVYLSFFIMSQFSTKNRASKIDLRSLIFFSNKLDKISREAVSCRTAQNVPTFFSKNFVLRCPEMYITQTLPNQNSDDGQRRQLPFPMRCYFLFPIPHWHTIVFFCYQRKIKKENLLRPAVQSWKLQE